MKGSAFISVAVDRGSRTPCFMQIYKQLRNAISTGRIAPSERLPSTRRFARELGVSRSTMVYAYDYLISEGLAEARERSAVYAAECRSSFSEPAALARGKQYWSEGKEDRLLSPDSIPMDLFPSKIWARAVARITRDSTSGLTVGTPLFGDMRLREEITRHLFERRGIRIEPSQVMVTTGSADSLKIVLRTLATRGDIVAMDDPGAVAIHRYALALGFKPHWLDASQPDAVEHGAALNPRILMFSASHSIPLGTKLSDEGHRALLSLSERQQTWIIEDDSDFEFQAGLPRPSLFEQSGKSRVIYVGTFSRVISHGVGLAYMVLPESLIEVMREGIKAFDQRASPIQQPPLAEMMSDGSFERCLRDMRIAYLERRTTLLESLHRALGDIVEIPRDGTGLQIVLRLPNEVDDVALAAEAQALGLFCGALNESCSGPKRLSGLVLGCGSAVAPSFEKKLEDLRDLLAAHLKTSAHPAREALTPRSLQRNPTREEYRR